MVQTSQNGTLLPKLRSDQGEKLLIGIYEADHADKLGKALFAMIGYLMSYQTCVLFFRHLEFELPCRFTPQKFKPVIDAYMARHHKHDIWLRRSPVRPDVTAVRHGDHTPAAILRRSAFYRHVLKPIGAEYGASVVAWRGTTWLSTVTVMRNGEQGEFSDGLMAELNALQPHFECVIRRMASHQESRLVQTSLRRVMAGLPVASVVLDWNLKPLEHSGKAALYCWHWTQETRSALLKVPRTLRVPGAILSAAADLRLAISRRKKSGKVRPPSSIRAVKVTHPHPRMSWLSASIEFVPSRTLALSKGAFVVTLNDDSPVSDRTGVLRGFNGLTPRERDCALLAAEGLHNDEIAKKLGKSTITVRNQLTSIYRKLGIDSRHKLVAAFARNKESISRLAGSTGDRLP
jgi:DNA-binding CsgD family transcriptional regulator